MNVSHTLDELQMMAAAFRMFQLSSGLVMQVLGNHSKINVHVLLHCSANHCYVKSSFARLWACM